MCYLRASFTPYTSTSLVLTATHYQGAMQAYAALGDERRYPGKHSHKQVSPSLPTGSCHVEVSVTMLGVVGNFNGTHFPHEQRIFVKK
jgi:hypothetical protein